MMIMICFLKTRTEAVFWSGFSCRELSLILSSFKPVRYVLRNGKIPVQNIRRCRETFRPCVQSPAAGLGLQLATYHSPGIGKSF